MPFGNSIGKRHFLYCVHPFTQLCGRGACKDGNGLHGLDDGGNGNSYGYYQGAGSIKRKDFYVLSSLQYLSVGFESVGQRGEAVECGRETRVPENMRHLGFHLRCGGGCGESAGNANAVLSCGMRDGGGGGAAGDWKGV